MQHAACSMQHAACNIQLDTCDVRHATRNMQHAACSTQHAPSFSRGTWFEHGEPFRFWQQDCMFDGEARWCAHACACALLVHSCVIAPVWAIDSLASAALAVGQTRKTRRRKTHCQKTRCRRSRRKTHCQKTRCRRSRRRTRCRKTRGPASPEGNSGTPSLRASSLPLRLWFRAPSRNRRRTMFRLRVRSSPSRACAARAHDTWRGRERRARSLSQRSARCLSQRRARCLSQRSARCLSQRRARCPSPKCARSPGRAHCPSQTANQGEAQSHCDQSLV